MSLALTSRRAALLPGRWVSNELWRRARAVPSLDLRFAENKSLVDSVSGQNLITFTRASTGTYVDSDGVIRSAATNLLLQSEDFSTTWTGNATVTANVATAPNGTLTADRITGTGISTTQSRSQFGLTTTVNPVSVSVYAKRETHQWLQVFTDVDITLWANFDLLNGAVGSVGSNTQAQIISIGDGWYRCVINKIAANASAPTGVRMYLVGSDTAGRNSSSDTGGSILVWGAQLEVGSTATPYIPTGATINSAPRFDHNPLTGECLGLLVEEQRVNSIRNNTMVGAVAGTPGTLPTNWSVAFSPSGLSYAVVGTGSTSGIPYVDIQITGTPSANGTAQITFEQNAVIGALSGQTWTGSMYCSLEAGTLPGTAALLVIERSGAGSFLASSSTNFVPVAGSLITQKTVHTRALNNASTAFTNLRIDASVTSGVAVDFTLRIGLPQLEQGAFATSVIPTTGTAATRTADVVSISGTNFSSWYRADLGTVYARCFCSNFAAINAVVSFDDSTSNNRIQPRTQIGGNGSLVVVDGGASQANLSTANAGSITANYTLAAVYAQNDFAVTLNGRAMATDTAGTVPAVTRATIGTGAGLTGLNGAVSRLTFWPRRLDNSTLQSITQ